MRSWKSRLRIFLYLSSPGAAALVYLLMEHNYRPPAPADPLLSLLFALGLLAIAAVSLVVGAGLFLWPALVSSQNPADVVAWWPWSLTPVTTQVLGGWYLAACFASADYRHRYSSSWSPYSRGKPEREVHGFEGEAADI